MSSHVRVLNTSHVRPVQNDDGPCHGELKLSLFDVPQIPKKIQRLFFFDGPDLPPFPSIVSALRTSLAATLAVYLPLAGKLAFRPVSGDVVLDVSPAAVSSGVRFVEAEFSGGADGMRRLARDAEHDTRAFAQLVPELEARQLPAPVLAVQVTGPAGPAGGGVAVGVSIWHAVADGHAVWMFLRAWSTAAREGSGAFALVAAGFVPPTFDRAGIRHPRAAEVVRMELSSVAPELPLLRSAPSSILEAEMMQEHRRRTFLLHADEIRSLKHYILEQRQSRSGGGGEPSSKPPSTYVAISSLAWASIVRATPSVHDADDVQFMVSADCRNRLRPPLGDAFFGNCIKPCFARARAGDLRGGEGGVARAAVAIQDAIRAGLDELGDDPLSDAESWMASFAAVPPERLVSAASSHRFMAYETDFGWGAPARVELVLSMSVRNHVALLGAKDGAVQVSVALDGAAAMETFVANFVVPPCLLCISDVSSNTSASGSLSWGDG